MNNLLALALNKVSAGVIIIDSQQRIILWNKWLENLSGKMSQETMGTQLTQVSPLFKKQLYQNYIANALENGQSMFCSGAFHSVFIPSKDGTDVRQNMQIEPLSVDDQRFVLMQIFDITNQHKRVLLLKNTIKELETTQQELKTMEQAIRHQAYHDSLTNLPNRLMFMEQFDRILDVARSDGYKVAVLFIDLDGFKEVNDTYGHALGDTLLKVVASRLRNSLRRSDLVARIGGDEFILFLPKVETCADLNLVSCKILSTIREPMDLEGNQVSISASMGAAFFPQDGEDVDNLLKKADTAMYAAKGKGKDTCQIYESPDS